VPGDQVLLRQAKRNKLTTAFETTPYEVVEKNGSSVVVESPQHVRYKRNVTEVKQYLPPECGDSHEDDPLVPDRDDFMTEETYADDTDVPSPEKTQMRSTRPQRERRVPAKFNDYVTS
jgi:hypothetical protein